MVQGKNIAVVIPCYKVGKRVLSLIAAIGSEVDHIYVVDDACPVNTGKIVQAECKDPRVEVIILHNNLGVGGAVITGFSHAYKDGYQIFVKLDGDGQMDPALIPAFVAPILQKSADYTKGNRFYSPRALQAMPLLRKMGNMGISLLAKLANGYWNTMDPANGYLAIHRNVFANLDVEKISKRFFFENDLLFRLGLVRAVVQDIPMQALYADEKSNLSVWHSLRTFPAKFLIRFIKRVLYRYYIRDFNAASLMLFMGLVLFLFGAIFGAIQWHASVLSGVPASSGTVMLAALPTILGYQMLLFFLLFDVMTVPQERISDRLNLSAASPFA